MGRQRRKRGGRPKTPDGLLLEVVGGTRTLLKQAHRLQISSLIQREMEQNFPAGLTLGVADRSGKLRPDLVEVRLKRFVSRTLDLPVRAEGVPAQGGPAFGGEARTVVGPVNSPFDRPACRTGRLRANGISTGKLKSLPGRLDVDELRGPSV